MKSKTPKTKDPSGSDVSSFIDGAEPNAKKAGSTALPWEAPHLRDDVTKVFNLRLSEKHFEMLKYLAENQKRESMQSICLDTLEPMLERECLALAKKLNT